MNSVFFPFFSSVGEWLFDVITRRFFIIKPVFGRPVDICCINWTSDFEQERVSSFDRRVD